ncbi:MAG: universal stress protein [Anaerolineae bacterium]|nr:universal stress protein [Anaerolineae bacterium]
MSILISVAGMPCARHTIQLGGKVARLYGEKVTLLHVVGKKEQQAAGKPLLDEAEKLLPGIEVGKQVRRGDPVERILAEIREGDYQLLVIGSYQGIPLVQAIVGSIPLKATRCVPISVLIVRPHEPRLERFLVCTGGLSVADAVIETGARLAGLAGAFVTLLHIASPIPSMYTGLGEIEETLSELLQSDTVVARHLNKGAQTLARYGVTAELALRHGVAADEIIKDAEEGNYDLLVLGASGTAGRLRGALMGSVTRQVLERAPCSVLVVRPCKEQQAR